MEIPAWRCDCLTINFAWSWKEACLFCGYPKCKAEAWSHRKPGTQASTETGLRNDSAVYGAESPSPISFPHCRELLQFGKTCNAILAQRKWWKIDWPMKSYEVCIFAGFWLPAFSIRPHRPRVNLNLLRNASCNLFWILHGHVFDPFMDEVSMRESQVGSYFRENAMEGESLIPICSIRDPRKQRNELNVAGKLQCEFVVLQVSLLWRDTLLLVQEQHSLMGGLKMSLKVTDLGRSDLWVLSWWCVRCYADSRCVWWESTEDELVSSLWSQDPKVNPENTCRGENCLPLRQKSDKNALLMLRSPIWLQKIRSRLRTVVSTHYWHVTTTMKVQALMTGLQKKGTVNLTRIFRKYGVFLNAANDIANEFFWVCELIVHTEGCRNLVASFAKGCKSF